ncbi:dual specificity protein phosphatase family protein [Undibacterium umbellatum]|uniref:Dual specificity protein phosphatase family protein n=1 Tax=Undibacterium umbellatum TaxID=2762300 RepID=A0ABR6Z7D6_9BURK|nr:dual specificity protein phosphatase family protein [Undibacterium umbellatum]MBC3907285.1 dual specificity protein phosphatase family protein [Undibacterium umbellatum]
MQNKRLVVSLAALSCAAFLLTTNVASAQENRPADWATPVAEAQNLYRIHQDFYRSAQLDSKDVALLQSLGIKTVVSLRSFHSDDKLLKDSSIRLQRVGINTWSINDQNVIAALRAIKAAEKDGPVLLHCLHGADRTGLVTAMYRILYQAWSKEQAMEELIKGGYGYHSMWRNIPKYLKKVNIEKIREGVSQP